MKFKECLHILSIMVRVFTDCPCYTVPEEGKLIKYSHQMSPPPNKEFWVFLSFPKVLTDFFYVQVPNECLLIVQGELPLRSVDWLSSLYCTCNRLSVDIRVS